MGGKKKPEKKADGEEGPLSEEQMAHLLGLTNTSMQWQLAEKTNDLKSSESDIKNLRKEVQVLAEKFEKEQQATFEITKRMTKEYVSMQEELKSAIEKSMEDISTLKNKLAESKSKINETVEYKDQIIRRKDNEIEYLKQKSEDMTSEFGSMLKETLDKMRERIEINNIHNNYFENTQQSNNTSNPSDKTNNESKSQNNNSKNRDNETKNQIEKTMEDFQNMTSKFGLK